MKTYFSGFFILTLAIACVNKPKDNIKDLKDVLKQIKPEVIILIKP